MSEEATAFLRARRRPLELVIFDCDGVLIDSEALCNRVVAEILTEDGWPMSADECEKRFIGMSFYAMQPVIEAQVGRPLGAEWVDRVVAVVTSAMENEVEPMPGARKALDAMGSLRLPWRIASNSSHGEMEAKFGRAGWMELVAGRVHSSVDVIAIGGAGKPAPDVYLAAAAAEGVPSAHCLVIEDSVTGVTAARAAGMDCLGLARHHDGADLRAAGAVVFHSMHDLPDSLASGIVLIALYPWIKSFHVIAMVAWMAGMFYLPRLFVYHCDTKPGSTDSERFKVMEYRLLTQIINPAMIATFVFGIILILTPGVIVWTTGWWYVKLTCVLLMTGFHGAMSKWRREFMEDRNTRPQRFYRIANEVPTVLLVVIVIMVIVRPF